MRRHPRFRPVRSLKRYPAACSLPLLLTVVQLIALQSAALAGELKIGLIPEQNVFEQVKRYRPIGAYLQDTIGHEVRFTILSRYGNIVDSFKTEKMDGAFWGSFTGALAIEKLGVEPLARPLWQDKSSTYHGYIFVRKGDGIRGVNDMKGKVIAFVDKATTAGYLFPLAYLREHGVKDVESFFEEHYFAGSHDATIHAVLEGAADIGCAKNTIFELVAKKDKSVRQRLTILAESPKVPSNGLCVRKTLDPATKKALTDALLSMHEHPTGKKALETFGALRFIATTEKDYAPVVQLARSAGIDLEKYQYVND